MTLTVGLLSACLVVAATALAYSPRVAASPRLSHWATQLAFYLGVTLLICPGALWLFIAFGGPDEAREGRGEATIFFMMPALYVLFFRALPAVLQGIASWPALERALVRLLQVCLGAVLLLGLVQFLTHDPLQAIGATLDRLPPWGLLALAGLVAVGIVTLLSHILGWVVGFWLDPVDRKIAMYTWGESETQTLGCFVAFLLGLGLAVLYGLVRFVKWAWSD